MSNVFQDTEISIADSETVILVEPEYMEWVLPVLVATPDKVIGKVNCTGLVLALQIVKCCS